ncbi:MAG TPA: hypothetical protein DCX67_04820 [Opitutae bacterium]|nr:hypothetical protein [Opitutae bacterium]
MKILTALGKVCAIGGTVAGMLNWLWVEFLLEDVNWEGPWMTLNKVSWILNILGFGLGISLIGAASFLSPSKAK